MKQIKQSLLASLKMLGIMTVICGGIYTLLVTGIGQVIFPNQAKGSVIEASSSTGDKRVVGSALIGQTFTSDEFLQGRPEDVASNLSPVSTEQRALVMARIAKLKQANPQKAEAIPSELVLASASGLDPEISVAGAEFQVERIAEARQIDPSEVKKVIEKHTSGQVFGKIGTTRVNVLEVNLELAGYTIK